MKIIKSNPSLYWPVYCYIEEEVSKLFFSIHCDDNQLDIYSVSIADLITRAAVEIEAISIDLYFRSGGNVKQNKAKTKTLNLKYDDDCPAFLDLKWKLSEKSILIVNQMYFGTIKSFSPFKKR